MSKIIIAPYAAQLPSGKPNAKNYPHWERLVVLLNKNGYEVIQIGVSGEQRIAGVSEFFTDLKLNEIIDLVNGAATWISVDSLLPHICYCYKLKAGIVLFSQSDPHIWGHQENINLLRGRNYLKQWQFQGWEAAEFNSQAFTYAENVMESVYKLAPMPLTRRLALV